MTRDDLMGVHDKLVAAGRALGGNASGLAYFIEQASTLFSLSKWKVGAQVELALTPQIDERHAWGWLSAKHFIIEGARAEVVDVHFSNGAFTYYVVFADESWAAVGPVTDKARKARFCIPEAWLQGVR